MRYGSIGAPNNWNYSFVRRGQMWFLDVTAAALAGNLSLVQIVNPAGSGVNVMLCGFNPLGGAAMNARLVETDAARTTLVGGGNNMLLGGPASKAQIYTDAIAANGTALARALLGTGLLTNIASSGGTPSFLIPPGKGLEWQGETVNTALTVRSWWVER